MKNSKIEITFWGTRGSIPAPGKDKSKYGGNTSCIEINLPNHELIILDAGTGIRELGNSFMLRNEKVHAHIFISHYHWDHIQGLPFFAPAYHAGNELTIWGPEHSEFPLNRILSSQMESIHFPVESSSLSANITFKKLSPENYFFSDTELKILRTNHPGINFSYSFTSNTRRVIYMTDNELLPKVAKAKSHITYEREDFIRFTHGADILIHDAQFSNADYFKKKGWGHSPWREVAKLAAESEVKHLVLFHHDPNHNDAIIDSFVKECKEELKKMRPSIRCSGAMEGKTISL